MNPVQWLARSRLRLAISAAVAFVVLFGAAKPVAGYVRHASESVVVDMVILTSWVVALLFGGVCLAVLVADLVLPHQWRRRVLLGEDVSKDARTEEEAMAASSASNHMVPFSIVAFVVLALGAGGLEAVTGGFFTEYQRVGYKRTILRSDDAEAKVKLLGELAEVHRPAFVRNSIELLRETWDDEAQPPTVRRAALQSLGRLSKSLVSSAVSWADRGERDHWEFDLLEKLRGELAPKLRERYPDAPPKVGRAMVLVLGHLRDLDSVEVLVERVQSHVDPGDPVWRGEVLAIGLTRSHDALEPLVGVADRVGEPEGFEALAFAVGTISQHNVPDSLENAESVYGRLVDVFGAAANRDDLRRRCVAVEVLRRTGDARVSGPLFEAFEASVASKTCPVVRIEVGEPAPRVFVGDESLRLRIVRALAMVAAGNEEVIAWAEERLEQGDYAGGVESALRSLVEMARAKEEAG